MTKNQKAYNAVIRCVRGVAERANARFKNAFKALTLVSLSRAGAIAKAALVSGVHLAQKGSVVVAQAWPQL